MKGKQKTEMQPLNIDIDKKLHTTIKVNAVKKGKSMRAYVEEILQKEVGTESGGTEKNE